eukprot:66068-Chlamydomonas_euryale.AAC.5
MTCSNAPGPNPSNSPRLARLSNAPNGTRPPLAAPDAGPISAASAPTWGAASCLPAKAPYNASAAAIDGCCIPSHPDVTSASVANVSEERERPSWKMVRGPCTCRGTQVRSSVNVTATVTGRHTGDIVGNLHCNLQTSETLPWLIQPGNI